MRELVARTGVTPRQVRYLIAEGFIPGPRGGRATADYGEDHVAAIRRYRRLRDSGFLPSAIKLFLEAGGTINLPIAPGVSLQIDNSIALDPGEVAQIVSKISETLHDVCLPKTERRHEKKED